MSASDWVIDILLVGLVLRQIRPRVITARSILLPAVLLAVAGSEYLKGFPTGGNDVLMVVILIAVGAVFGAISGTTTRMYLANPGQVVCRAGVVAASVWVLGMGIRMAFDIWAHTTSGEHHLVHFSIHHSITSADAYSTAFVLMAFAQVILRVGILQWRRIQLEGGQPRRMPEPA